MKFLSQMKDIKSQLEKLGHTVFIPSKEGLDNSSVDYWSDDHTYRAKIKKSHGVIDEHMDKIDKADAILVVNITKKEIENYIGANTFLEMGYAYRLKKKIFTLNPLPDQPYISDELLAFDTMVLDGKLELIK